MSEFKIDHTVGQSYVALSRAASLDGLQVLRFDPKKVNISSINLDD